VKVVSVMVGLRCMSGSMLDGCRIRSRPKTSICLLYSCIALNFMSLWVWFKLAIKCRGVTYWNHMQSKYYLDDERMNFTFFGVEMMFCMFILKVL
jgi:hypothetical protein